MKNCEYILSESDSKSSKKEQKRENKQQLLMEKFKLEERLQEIRNQYGSSKPANPLPKNPLVRWNYVLNELSQKHESLSERQDVFRFRTKKLAELANIKREKYQEIAREKFLTEQRNIEKYYDKISKIVQREFWRNMNSVRKQRELLQQDKLKQECQKQKLDDIVIKLNDVTEDIGKKLQNYHTVQNADENLVNQIPIDRYRSLYQQLQRRSTHFKFVKLEVKKTNIILEFKKTGDKQYEFTRQLDALFMDEKYLDVDESIAQFQQMPEYKFLFEKQENLLEQQPFLLQGTLRSYQLVGMQWMASLHQSQMNGILADEMGLGKTIQTIALLAYLASNKGIWGPHLVIVPTSILVNWEIEFKRWCPAFKIMTYFGSPKERKLKRQGWSQLNQFHVCITSYKIVIQDAKVFRRKRWYYMILDEAQHIKNFKSQRWQLLLNFNTRARLLLTGTPLQNDLGEIWSLLHFLMPTIFDSHTDFLEWFIGIEKAIQENKTVKEDVLKKLHNILRPFVLRRLKKDVEKQLPSKQEVVIKCQLSRRQKYLYDEFIQSSGNVQIVNTDFVTVMNVVQQLRKVCNHPELFEQRPVAQPFLFQSLTFQYPRLILIERFNLQFDKFAVQQRLPNIQVIEGYLSILDKKYNLQQKNAFNKRWLDIEHNNSKQRVVDNMKQIYQRIIRYHALLHYQQSTLQVKLKQIPTPVMPSIEEVFYRLQPLIEEFSCIIRKADALPQKIYFTPYLQETDPPAIPNIDNIFPMIQKQRMLFPSKKLLIYDCGKMNTMVDLIYKLKSENHKIIIFTQMTKMLDILEGVLSQCKISYLRLDGTTPVEMRQKLVERFNQLNITCFISSTRSGGIGINLTGADTVIFYDTDWNPAMDKQAQDRCHRIGQTRSVTIYRLITNATIEENILLKAMQKRQLDDFVMQSGMFSAEQIIKQSQLFGDEDLVDQAIKQVEDKEDRQAAQRAMLEEQNYQIDGIGEIMDIDENNEWLNIQSFPPLMKYGLKMQDMIHQNQIKEQAEHDLRRQEERLLNQDDDEDDNEDSAQGSQDENGDSQNENNSESQNDDEESQNNDQSQKNGNKIEEESDSDDDENKINGKQENHSSNNKSEKLEDAHIH